MTRNLPTVPPASSADRGRRRCLAGLALMPLATVLPAAAQAANGACLPATDWTSFAARHVQADGRIVDFDTPKQHSTSEGQSYGLFFALVHNDRAAFARILEWTEKNLAAGSLAQRLPAWQWGHKPDDSWGVLDDNPASDSDLWIAYSLLEAGRLWNEPRYQNLGRTVLALAARDEVATLPGLGRILLPWPKAIAKGPAWRLNPSYLPLQLLRRFQQVDGKGPWGEIADNTVRMIAAVSPHGFTPDWCAWSTQEQAFVADPEKGAVGSYDAIRVYLWAGMLNASDPARQPLLKSLYGPRRLLEQKKPMPEFVDTDTGVTRGTGPVGFSGALLPYLKAQGLAPQLDAELARVRARVGSPAQPAPTPLPYYERMLLLFGQAWLDGRYAFSRTGQLQTHWRLLCPATQLA
ncbi:cellulose synthase complex periplasmic endoglucanase BcsZ [Variovorax saccharolyticus]|uniref:cellulose synthase complex periplasmic endoglucanase BcsZ n=1 Tax=Variovorax saccharolyticus TaxID=3053516 RepID=UPI002577EFC6|nr:cellulose synthase complex periplasmic endoglucanase BcsZ [Variovorax sp. J22R187]MDM0020208.1 cellulose synthase complex periplasmic endoglucanase BcsZ [Variovorax sp. J22R187]